MFEKAHKDEHQTVEFIVDQVGSIMAADEELELLVVYNGYATFNPYSKVNCKTENCWIPVDIKTVYSYDDAPTMRFGMDESEEWLREIRIENSEGDF